MIIKYLHKRAYKSSARFLFEAIIIAGGNINNRQCVTH